MKAMRFCACRGICFMNLFAGVAVGSVFSLLLFKRKLWPLTFGAGGIVKENSLCKYLFFRCRIWNGIHKLPAQAQQSSHDTCQQIEKAGIG